MPVNIHRDCLVANLWAKEPAMLANGRFLQFHFGNDSGGGGNSAKSAFGVTSFAFHPVDESQAAIGTSAGVVYGVSLRDNKAFLLADLGVRAPVRAVVFDLGPGGAELRVVAVSEGNTVTLMDWSSSAVLFQTRCPVHARPITAVVTAQSGGGYARLVLLVSGDAVTCWAPAVASGGVGAPAALVCIAHTAPTQRTFRMDPLDGGADSAPKETPRFLAAHWCLGFVFTTETNGVVSRWAVPQEAFGFPANPAVALILDNCVRTDPFDPSCSACCSAFIAFGSRDSAAVALVNPDTLEGLGVFHIQTEELGSGEGGKRGPQAIPKRDGATVSRVDIVGDELVFCTLSDGRVVCVAASTHQCTFVLRAPQAGVANRFCVPVAWAFVPSGPTYGMYTSAADCVLFHLPTAKGYHERCAQLYREEKQGGSLVTVSAGGPEPGASGDVLTFTIKAVSFLTQRGEQGESTAATSRVVRPDPHNSDQGRPQTPAAIRKQQQRFPRVPLSFDPKKFNNADPRRGWFDVNAVTDTPTAGGASPEAKRDERGLSVLSRALYCDALSDAACAYNMAQLRDYLNKHGAFPRRFRAPIWRFVLGLPDKRVTGPQFAALARRPTHGCVASQLEPYPLPASPARTAMERCLSVLAHHHPAFAMADFMPAFVFPFVHVFGDQDVQSLVEVLLVYFQNWGNDFFLCYPQPPASLMHFAHRRLAAHDPALAQHLDQIGCGPDIWGWQPMLSMLTDILTGGEWLQVMDHAVLMEPMWVFLLQLALLNLHRSTILRDADSIDSMLAILSTPFSQQQQQRGAPDSGGGGGGMMKKQPGGGGAAFVPAAIKLAYDLYARCPRDAPFMAKYFHFTAPDPATGYGYPRAFPVDEELLGTRMSELSSEEARRGEQRQAESRLRHLAEEAERAALQDEVALHEQRARMAAKYESSAEMWRARVALEKTRQDREADEREVRLAALRRRVASAEELEQLRAEMAAVDAQGRHEVVDRLLEQHKWMLSAHLTDADLDQLERDTEGRIAHGLRRLATGGGGRGAAECGNGNGDDSAGSMAGHAPRRGGAREDDHTRAPHGGIGSGSDDAGVAAGADNLSPVRALRTAEQTLVMGSPPDAQRSGSRPAEGLSGGRSASAPSAFQPFTPVSPPLAPIFYAPPIGHGNDNHHADDDDDDYGLPLEDDEEDMAAYHNHEEYPTYSGGEEDDSFYNNEDISGNVNHTRADDGHGDDGAGGADGSGFLQSPPPPPGETSLGEALGGQQPRAAPLPLHMKPFVPSADLLRALQSYRRPLAPPSAAFPAPLTNSPIIANGFFAPGPPVDAAPVAVVPPFLAHYEMLQAGVMRLRQQAQSSSSPLQHNNNAVNTSAMTGGSSAGYGSSQPPPSATKDRIDELRRNKRNLFDNLSDDPTPTTTTATTDALATTTTMTTMTTLTSSSMPTTGTDTEARGGRRRPFLGATSGATGTTEAISSSAGSAVQRPWRDEYYWSCHGSHGAT